METSSDKELEVALILHSLPELILRSAPCRRNNPHSWRWATKKARTRSVHRSEKHLNSISARFHFPSSPASHTNQHPLDLPHLGDSQKLKGKSPTSEPASPLDFYPTGEDTDSKPAVAADAEISVPTRRANKIKVKSKEWMNDHIRLACSLSESNKLLEQEKAKYAKHHAQLLEENSRLKKILAESKLTVAKERHHPHLPQQSSNQLRNYPTSEGPGRPIVGQSPDHHLPPLECEGLTKTAAGLSPPPQPPTPIQSLVEIKPLTCLATATPVVLHQFDPAPVRFWGLDNGYVRLVDGRAQVAIGRFGSLETELMVDERSQPSDTKRTATANARKRRMEINRMKSAGTAGSASFRKAARFEMTASQM